MSNNMRHRYGDKDPVMLTPDTTTTVIDIGDPVKKDANGKAADFNGDQTADVAAFAGISMQASPNDKADPVRVAQDGVFEFPAESADSVNEVGDDVQFVSSSQVVKAAAAGLRTGYVEAVGSGTSRLIRILTAFRNRTSGA